ncbi:PREDICTED: solute carrier family 15 member 4-like [Branchiostoma belcheri]|uniref:Solute carrier family 15 member 4-like n=1 Tax=Branchiostoma belcheri TaxID=7741 RepID=A0A6P4ZWA7_BRABE|nr:PREDICTED: solute carrier family 15 member 4-like [Branchiostoma belcheri]
MTELAAADEISSSPSSGYNSDDDNERIPLLGTDKGPTTTRDRKPPFGPIIGIFSIEVCERVAYYATVANLVLFCTRDLYYTSTEAVTLSLLFTGLGCTVPPLGGVLADSLIGKYRAICATAFLHFVGMACMVAVAFPFESYFGPENSPSKETLDSIFPAALVVVAIATGGIKANVSPFAAQQAQGMMGAQMERSFFNWYFWFLNVGTFFSIAVLSYVEQDVAFWIGFLVPTILMFCACANLMLMGCLGKVYKDSPNGIVLLKTFKILFLAAGSVCNRRRAVGCLDSVKLEHGGRYPGEDVEDVKKLGRILPVFLLQIMYRTVFFQMQTTYFLQGERMNLNFGSFELPVAALNLFYVVTVLLFVPLMDRVVYPAMDRCRINLPLLKRIGIGMTLGMVSVAWAAMVEMLRKHTLVSPGGAFQQDVGGERFTAANMCILWQIPQFALVGCGEVFVMAAGSQFAYSQAPKSLRGVVFGCFALTFAFGSFFGSILVDPFPFCHPFRIFLGAEWLPDELNDGHADYFFLLLSGLMAVNLLIFAYVATHYTYVTAENADVDKHADVDDVNHSDNADSLKTSLIESLDMTA